MNTEVVDNADTEKPEIEPAVVAPIETIEDLIS